MKKLSFRGLKVGSKEYMRVANRRYYHRHREEEKARSKAWCLANPEKRKAWAEKNKERCRANNRKCEYNLSNSDFQKLLKEQKKRCALCLCKLKNPDVDHDHSCCGRRYTCGKCNRGLLCHRCNTALGLFQESSKILKRTIKYLLSWKKKHGKGKQ